MYNQTKRTAIRRKKASAPTKVLYELGVLEPPTLDFGCGYGDDVEAFGFDGYDPNFEPFTGWPTKQYKTIICNYVFCVVPKFTRQRLLYELSDLLLDESGSGAFITVRRDIRKDYVTSRGTQQYVVQLPLLSIQKTPSYEIYLLTKGKVPNIL